MALDIISLRNSLCSLRKNSFQNAATASAISPMMVDFSTSVDEVLQNLWRHFINDNTALSLIAVGGYGRQELHPHSDIDLLILGEEASLASQGEKLSAFITALWDLKLDVGHSVRTLQECIDLGSTDITVATNMVEARFLCGCESQFTALVEAIFNDRIMTSYDFFKAKFTEQKERHISQGDTGYKVEPNIKESPGCLRDIHSIWWVAKRHFKTPYTRDLLAQGFITQDEFDALTHAHEFLLKVRTLLHLHLNKHEDKLLLDYQREMAMQLGYKCDKPNGSVEAFMQDFFRAVHAITYFNELLLGILDEQLHPTTQCEIIQPHPDFQLCNGRVSTISNDVFSRPENIFSLFTLLQSFPYNTSISPSTLRQLRTAVISIDENFRNHPVHQQQFLRFFTHGHGLTHTLRRLGRYNLLGAYLPAFQDITGLMQFDLFHHFTVDEHTLLVVRNVRRFFIDKHSSEHPQCSEVALSVKKPHLIYLAALFHDIAKGRGGAHEILGAEDALTFCLQHGLPQADAENIAWVVRAHLEMSFTAQRRDITNPDVIAEFSHRVGTVGRLKLLYLLTVADIKSTNPNLWNDFKDSLLRDLYLRTLRHLKNEADSLADRDEKQRQTFELLGDDSNEKAKKLKTIWSGVRDDYFRRFKPQEIAWHAQQLLRFNGSPQVSLRYNMARQCSEVIIITNDRPALFAGIAAILGTHQLNIVAASLHTLEGNITMDSFFVINEEGGAVQDKHIAEQVEFDISQFIEKNQPPTLPQNKLSRQLRNFDQRVDIGFEQDAQLGRTVVLLEALDHTGLLAHIGEVFSRHEIDLQGAIITTSGERVYDTFFIADENGRPITNSEQLTQIKDDLIEAISKALMWKA